VDVNPTNKRSWPT